MRKSRDLSAGEKQNAQSHLPAILMAGVAGREVTVTFIKQNSDPRVLTGTVENVSGEGDKEIVTIKQKDGSFRSANLSRILNVEIG